GALAALTKETYLLVAWALAAWHWRDGRRTAAAGLALVPMLPLLAWSGWLSATMPAGSGVRGNIGMPLRGLADAIPIWIRHERNPVEVALAVCTCLMLGGGLGSGVAAGLPAMRWVTVPW